MTKTPLVQVRGLRVTRGRHTILQIPELDVRQGEVLALIGPNGSGKSTLLRVLALLESAPMQYWMDGLPVRLPAAGPALRRQMGVVFQEPLLLNASVGTNVALGLRLRGLGRAERSRRAAVWLDRLGVGHLFGRRAHTLSGGEAQRVALARALVTEPRLLFLDEPFASLDVVTRQPLVEDLGRLIRASGTTAVFATHDFLEVLLLADRVAVLDGGAIVQLDVPRRAYEAPATERVRELIGATRAMVAALPSSARTPSEASP